MDLKNKNRLSLSIFFFLSGFCFSTWASRIPTIKTNFDLNEAELGTILLFMPVSSLLGLPISGWLTARFDTRTPLVIAFIAQTICLSLIGIADSTFILIAAICLFAFSMRIVNIAINTQAINLQKEFERKIIGSFHGVWSTGGIVGVGFSTLLVAFNVSMPAHLLMVSIITLVIILYSAQFLLRNDRSASGNKFSLGKPDPNILYLGLLIFCASICEGGMFDWSGIYFKEVINVEIFTFGYLIFMTFMAFSRFVSDRIIEKIGIAKTYILSSAFVAAGIALAVIIPEFWPAMIGFSLVGFGTASIVPMTYSLAGGSRKYSPGMAISIIATFGIMGMLIGPPLIGYIAHALNLRAAFIAFAVAGLLFIPISQMFFKYQKSQQSQRVITNG